MRQYLLIALILVASLVAGGLLALTLQPFASGSAPIPAGAVAHPDPYPAPDFALTDQEGAQRSLQDFRGRWVALFFGFTHCPDVCPLTLGKLGGAIEGLGDRGEEMVGVLVTVDPERDDPERLREYLDHFHPALVGLTGSEEEIRQVVDAYGILAERATGSPDDRTVGAASHGGTAGEEGEAGHDAPGAGHGYMVDHTSLILMIDPDGRVVTSFAPSVSTEELTEGLRLLLTRGPW